MSATIEEGRTAPPSVPAEGTSVHEVAERLRSQFGRAEGEWEWGLDAVYLLYDRRHDIAVVGVTGERVEGDAFRIVVPAGTTTGRR
jgi:hypothetical protein